MDSVVQRVKEKVQVVSYKRIDRYYPIIFHKGVIFTWWHILRCFFFWARIGKGKIATASTIFFSLLGSFVLSHFCFPLILAFSVFSFPFIHIVSFHCLIEHTLPTSLLFCCCFQRLASFFFFFFVSPSPPIWQIQRNLFVCGSGLI